jgi:hypothetical protein
MSGDNKKKRKRGRPPGSKNIRPEDRKPPRLKGNFKPLTVTQLAKALGRSRQYVSIMRRAGFPMVDGKATINEALDWLWLTRRWFTTSNDFIAGLPRLQDQGRPDDENIRVRKDL